MLGRRLAVPPGPNRRQIVVPLALHPDQTAAQRPRQPSGQILRRHRVGGRHPERIGPGDERRLEPENEGRGRPRRGGPETPEPPAGEGQGVGRRQRGERDRRQQQVALGPGEESGARQGVPRHRHHHHPPGASLGAGPAPVGDPATEEQEARRRRGADQRTVEGGREGRRGAVHQHRQPPLSPAAVDLQVAPRSLHEDPQVRVERHEDGRRHPSGRRQPEQPPGALARLERRHHSQRQGGEDAVGLGGGDQPDPGSGQEIGPAGGPLEQVEGQPEGHENRDHQQAVRLDVGRQPQVLGHHRQQKGRQQARGRIEETAADQEQEPDAQHPVEGAQSAADQDRAGGEALARAHLEEVVARPPVDRLRRAQQGRLGQIREARIPPPGRLEPAVEDAGHVVQGVALVEEAPVVEPAAGEPDPHREGADEQQAEQEPHPPPAAPAGLPRVGCGRGEGHRVRRSVGVERPVATGL